MAPWFRASSPAASPGASSPVHPSMPLATVVGMPVTSTPAPEDLASTAVEVEMPMVMERDVGSNRVIPTAELAGYYSNDEGTLTAKLADYGDDTLKASGITCGFTPPCPGCGCPYDDEYYTRVDKSTNTFVASRGKGATGKLVFKTDLSGFDWPEMSATFMHRRR